MKIFTPSPKFRKHRNDVDSPTSPSDRPLMYLSSTSGSSSFDDLEEIPMLPNSEGSPRRSTGSDRNRRKRSMKPYLSCIVFLVLACLSYFYIREETATGKSPNELPSNVEIKDKKNQKVAVSSVQEQSLSTEATNSPSKAPTFNPTLRPSASVQHNAEAASAIEFKKSAEDSHPAGKGTDTEMGGKLKKEKNNLVLHIGPQKTGSTTLQDAWTGPNGVISQSLKQDNYRYRFIHPSHGFFNCEINNYGGYINCEASPKLKGLIRSTKNADQNLLLSDENLDDRFPETLRAVIDNNDWDVTVIVVYRRIHQWLVSWYDQINKTTNKDAKGNILLDSTGQPYRREHIKWPDEGGVHIPTFSSWYKDFTKYWDQSELVSKHRSIAFMNAYKPYFKNIVVHNMHQDGDLMTNFMCDSVPNAHHSCEQLRNRKKPLPRDNKSINLDYDILAVKAREEGFLKTRHLRKEVGTKIGAFVKRKNKQIPRICDVEMVDEIKNWLLDSEKAMFQDTWSDEKESDLKLSFDSYLESGKLCDIDFDQIFGDEEWLAFFKSLDNRPLLVLHVGPQKTGSTTLQHVWASPKELKSIMAEDNFDYHFINPHRGTFDCDLDGDRWANCKASKTLIEILKDASAERKNLLLSDENLDERFAGALRKVIHDNDFRVKVVLVYRRIHHWLPSWYSQINKTANKDSKGNLLRNENGQPVRLPHTKWPSEGGVYVPNFSIWYREFVDHFLSTDLVTIHPSISFKNAYEPYFDDIDVYKMEQEGDFVTNFMCQMIPEASKTCLRLKQGGIKLPLSNPSVNVEHDILSVQAYENGLIGDGLTRAHVVEEVRKRIQNSAIRLPRKCNQDVKDEIHDWLLDSEKAMFPDAWSPSSNDFLESDYASYYGRGTLCDIDIDAILEDNDWINFFATLEKR